MAIPSELKEYVIAKWLFDDMTAHPGCCDPPVEPTMTAIVKQQLKQTGYELQHLLASVEIIEPDVDGHGQARGGGFNLNL